MTPNPGLLPCFASQLAELDISVGETDTGLLECSLYFATSSQALQPSRNFCERNKAFLKISLQKFGNHTNLKKFKLFNTKQMKMLVFCGYYSLGAACIIMIITVSTVLVLQGYVFPPRFGFPPHISLGIYSRVYTSTRSRIRIRTNLDHNPYGRGGLSLDLNPVCLHAVSCV